MESREKKHGDSAPSRSLREAILQERLKEAENIDRLADRHGSELARLEILKAALDQAFEEIPSSDDRFMLTISPSDPARLWIDMFASVVMDSQARTYRLTWSGSRGREVLSETEDVDEIKSQVLEYVASQIVTRERELRGHVFTEPLDNRPQQRSGRGVGVVIWAFFVGLLAGAFPPAGLGLSGHALSQMCSSFSNLPCGLASPRPII